jgi:allophanate hydrolase subunit 2
MDAAAVARGNAHLANRPAAPALEMTLLGPELEAMSPVGVCVAGAPMTVEHNGVAASLEKPIRVAAGDRLRFGPARGGVRAYLCVEGGFQPPGRLGLIQPGQGAVGRCVATGETWVASGEAASDGLTPTDRAIGQAVVRDHEGPTISTAVGQHASRAVALAGGRRLWRLCQRHG